MSGPFGAGGRENALGDCLRAEQIRHASDLRTRRLIADALLVGQHRQLHPLAPAELSRLARGALADQDEVGARLLELLPGAIQLDGVLLAKNSSVVPEEDERGRPLRPKLAEAYLVAILVWQHDLAELVGT